eukprot:TRINITY_DN2747_c0_g1_i1.p1 TRINITY_DN2747_c0_g1~~TRINITY_DN2747_c0_g1_i1.p1  ORF type:complete len:126 (+),score=25.93 TRINITY_DN2747_c0_g1_i1:361-738(+)
MGKHGHAKTNLVGVDVFTGSKLTCMCPSSHNLDVPHVKRMDYQLMNVSDDNFSSLLGENGDTRNDLKLPENEMGDQIKEAFEEGHEVVVTVFSAMAMRPSSLSSSRPKISELSLLPRLHFGIHAR